MSAPPLAALASAVLPGAGQALMGAWGAAAAFAAPVLLLILAVLLALAMAPSRAILAGEVLQPPVLLTLLALDGLLLAYRLAAGAAAWGMARRRAGRTSPAGGLLLVLALAGLVVGPQLAAGAIIWQTYDTVTTVFGEPGSAFEVPPIVSPGVTPGASASPSPTPSPSPSPDWVARGRLNLLLLGADAGPGRWSLRTDTMILLSVDVASGRAAMFGLPRNLINVPLPPQWVHLWPCGCYPDLLNSLYVYASGHPAAFGGGKDVGFRALEATVASFTGVPLDGTAVVNLNGFVDLVDALGGLDINIPYAVYDANYPDESGARNIVVSFKPGPQHLDGHLALAYARSRHQDSDYGRMARQQIVLRALRAQLSPCSLVPRISELLGIAKANAWTDLPVTTLPDLLSLAARSHISAADSVTFVPPRYPELVTRAETAAIRAVVAGIFTGPAPSPPSSASPATPTPAPGGGC